MIVWPKKAHPKRIVVVEIARALTIKYAAAGKKQYTTESAKSEDSPNPTFLEWQNTKRIKIAST